MRVLPIVGLCLSLAGCFAHAVGVGNRFTPEQVDRLKIGMSKADVIAVMGSEPASVATTNENGHTREELGWVDLGAFSWRSVGAIFSDGKLIEIKKQSGP